MEIPSPSTSTSAHALWNPQRGPAHERFAPFLGRWHVEGMNGSSAIVGEESFEWLPGQYFILHRWLHYCGERTHQGLAVLGFRESEDAYFAHFYDELGYLREFRVELFEHEIRLHGAWERAQLSVDAGAGVLQSNWEHTREAGEWVRLRALHGSKRSPEPDAH